MAHGQHTTRRTLLTGAAAAIMVANVSGTVAAPQFTPDEILRMRAERVIKEYLVCGAMPIANAKENTLWLATYADGGNTHEELVRVDALNRQIKNDPMLKQKVIDLLCRD